MEDKTLQGVNFGIVAVGDTAMKRVFLGNDSEVDVTYNIFSSTPHFLVLPLALGTVAPQQAPSATTCTRL